MGPSLTVYTQVVLALAQEEQVGVSLVHRAFRR